MSTTQRLYGALAEFEDVDSLVAAAKKVRERGYRHWDAHTPFPVHGLDDAMGVRPTILPWIVLGGGLLGLGLGFLMQWWMNAVDYPFKISGKPFFGLPATVPVSYELAILLASFGAFFGMLILNSLPKWYHPLFRVRRFRRATADRFYLVIEGRDPLFDAERTPTFLADLGAFAVETVPVPDESPRLPRAVRGLAWLMTSLALIPPVLIFRARYSKSEHTRIHLVPNMDFQGKYKQQNTSPLFADGRAMRKDPPGTVARGELDRSSVLWTGKQPDGSWASALPLPVDDALMARGRERFDIYCAACHGLDGSGNSMVDLRATELTAQGKAAWTKPADLRLPRIAAQPPGQVFNTITHGLNTMPGYRQQIPARDRWAIILYMKALQRALPEEQK